MRRLAGVHHEKSGAVIVRLSVPGVNKRHFIDVLSKPGKNGRNHLARIVLAG